MAALLFKTILLTKALQSKGKKNNKFPPIPKKKLKHLCRICCKEQGTIPIFDNVIRPDLAQEIEMFANVSMNKLSYVADHMCQSCMRLLDCCLKFKELCETSCTLLASYNPVDTDKAIKSENSDEEDKYDETDYDYFVHPTSPPPLPEEPPPKKTPRSKKKTCKYCLQEFENMASLKEHKPCPANTRLKKLKTNHIKTYGKTNYPKVRQSCLCDVCGKTLTSPQILAVHMTTHSNDFPFECNVCPYKGRTRNLLLVHMRSHLTENERPYKCAHCPKATSTASNLNAHMRRAHSTSRPYKCNQCERTFTCTQDMKKHIKDIHLRQENVDCEICFKTFSNKKYLRKHQRKVHQMKSPRAHLPSRLPSYLQLSLENGNSWKEPVENQHNITNVTHQAPLILNTPTEQLHQL